MIGVCPRQVNRFMEQGVLPFYRRNRVVRFNPEEIAVVISSWRHPAAGEPRPTKRKAGRINPVEV